MSTPESKDSLDFNVEIDKRTSDLLAELTDMYGLTPEEVVLRAVEVRAVLKDAHHSGAVVEIREPGGQTLTTFRPSSILTWAETF